MSTLLGSPAPAFIYIRASAPDAPPFSETTTDCFISPFFWIAACIIRAIWSEAPPAPAATTISTGLVGSHAAWAGVAASRSASAPLRPVTDNVLDMIFSLQSANYSLLLRVPKHIERSATRRDTLSDVIRCYKGRVA